MAELPRQSSSGWRQSDRLVLLACVLMACVEVVVIFALGAIAEGAMAA
jgi:hypothetical protein